MHMFARDALPELRLLWFGQADTRQPLMDQSRGRFLPRLTDNSPTALARDRDTVAPISSRALAAPSRTATTRRNPAFDAVVSTGCHVFIGTMCLTGMVEVWHVFLPPEWPAFDPSTNRCGSHSSRDSAEEVMLNAIALNSSALSFMRIGGTASRASSSSVRIAGSTSSRRDLHLVTFTRWPCASSPERRAEDEHRRHLRPQGSFTYIAQTAHIGRSPPSRSSFRVRMPTSRCSCRLIAKEPWTSETPAWGSSCVLGHRRVGGHCSWRGIWHRAAGLQWCSHLIFGRRWCDFAAIDAHRHCLLLAVAGSMTVTYMAFTNGISSNTAPRDARAGDVALSLDRGLIRWARSSPVCLLRTSPSGRDYSPSG